jgi:hypothetical protein
MIDMDFLKKLFGSKEPSANKAHYLPEDQFQTISKPAIVNEKDLFDAHAGLSYEKQLLTADTIAGKPWQFDMSSGTIVFDGKLTVPVQIIGTVSYETGTWLWAWANTQSGIPPELLRDANRLREIGQRDGMEALTSASFPFVDSYDHKLALLSSGVCDASCYYRADYGSGAMYVTLHSDRLPGIDRDNLVKVPTAFSQLISALRIDHYKVWLNYLIDREFQIAKGDGYVASLRKGQQIRADFDTASRLTGIRASFHQ